MKQIIKYLFVSCTILSLFFLAWISGAAIDNFKDNYSYYNSSFLPPPDTPKTELPYPFKDDNNEYPYIEDESDLYLNDPSNIKTEIKYDPETNQYVFSKKIGDLDYRTPGYMSFDEYQDYDFNNSLRDYWRQKAKAQGIGGKKSGLLNINVPSEAFDRIFGGSTIDIRPQGSAELIFGINATRRDDPSLNVKQRRTANFDFQEKIQMNVTAKIGDKIELGTNYNTEATFDFENKMKLQYEGKEDEIIKLIEAGDVTMPLTGSLITGSQSLFGLKTKLQFGRTTVTSVFSQQKSKTSTIEVSGGAQISTFELKADQYEDNKHFFIAHYFRDQYERALSRLPLIGSTVNITKIEVWITNIGAATTENRNIVAFTDLGENDTAYIINNNVNPKTAFETKNPHYPQNGSNTLYEQMNNSTIRDINKVNSYLVTNFSYPFVAGLDFEKVENARKLSPNEYTFNSKLGFISLNNSLNSDQVLAVAYQYKIIGDPIDTVYQVGEFSNEGITAPNGLIVKLLKSTALNTKVPMWNLMMKNVYAIGAYQVNSQDFRLNILYSDDENGIPMGYLNESQIKGIPLIKVLRLDHLNTQLDPTPDGVFDFIDGAATNGGTIQASNGRVFFPVLEPFGKSLRDTINNTEIADKYAYDELYTLTKNGAQQYPDKNKFYLEGSYKSSSGSEISLNAMNVPQGSVKVTAGGIPLTENVDYTVDYTLGRVKIINEGILNSGTPIRISLESNSLFAVQTKTLMGTHFDYRVNKDLNLGATIMNLTERPLTQKINYGNEPISNTIWGLNASYQTESRLLTKIVDKIPFIDTKAPSNISFNGEFAHLIPGHARAIGKSGTSYIDDFEGSKSSIDLKQVSTWLIASTPQGQKDVFPEGDLTKNLAYGYNRAKLAWYVIDPIFFARKGSSSAATPDHIKNDKVQRSNNFVREILEKEVFPAKETPHGQPTNIAVLNLSYYPEERGPYNYDINKSPYSKGIDANGKLIDPNTRWGGIMRKIVSTDFEETNVEYIEFWMMDPFNEDDPNGTAHSGGELYFNLGDISEDILKDSRKSYENGLPTSAIVKNVDTTIWGRVPTLQALVRNFDNDATAREFQDVGLDGLRNADEKSFFDTYLQNIGLVVNPTVLPEIQNDPSGDDYHYFRGKDYDDDKVSILNRYKMYNGMDGNSPTSEQSSENYPTMATTLPNVEDINDDNTLSESERYYQYKIDLKPSKMNVGENYITDVYEATTDPLPDGTKKKIKWYQFKIPIRSPDKVVGNIQDFKSIRFMRMFFKGFTQPIHCRFATLELVRGEWRKYNYSLLSPGEYIPDDNTKTSFNVSAVNIEENGERTPIPYVLPPEIDREVNIGPTMQKLNEQSLVLKVCNLEDGDARATYKTCDFDVRQYKRLKMFVHAEGSGVNGEQLKNGDLTIFIRLGTDFTDNYYEYEIPLIVTPFGSYAKDDKIDDNGRYKIWPEKNWFDIEFDLLTDIKQQRNIEMRQSGSAISLSTPYIKYIGNNKITIVGVPNLNGIKTIMIGIRNPKKKSLNDNDDGLTKCGEIWANELRLTDFNEKGGWAAIARVNANLADFGNVVLAGNISTPGFGSIEEKVNERQRENITQYDIATNLELGKFFPEKAGLKIPMHFDYSEAISNPQYNPLNPDVIFKEDLKTYNEEEQKTIKNLSQDYTKRKNINFMNVRKDKTGASAKSHIYDVENFDFTYAYSEIFKRNVDIEYNFEKKYKGAIGYNFTNNPKRVSPFAKLKIIRKYKFLRLIQDFNFYYMPRMLSFRTDLDRQYNENLLRNKSKALLILEPTYVKTFTWNRVYNLKYDLAQSLKLDFTANANSRIDEPEGKIDTKTERDSIKDNIMNLGRLTNYNHKLDINYSIPINKLPLLDWVNASARYSAQYDWTAAPLSVKEQGNTIENSNTKQLNGSANLINLYNKIGYLKKINQKNRNPKTNLRNKIKDIEEIDKKDMKKDEKAKEDTTDTPKINYIKLATDNILKVLMSVKNVSLTYTEGNGTLLPGFGPYKKGDINYEPSLILGQDWNLMAPGTGFIFGSQRDIRDKAALDGWMTIDTMQLNPFAQKYTQNISARATIEPFPDFNIQVNADRNVSQMFQEFYKADRYEKFEHYNPTETGSFSISFLTWKTAFTKDNKDNSSDNFENFKKYRKEIAMRLAHENPNWNEQYITNSDVTDTTKNINNDAIGFPKGYGPTSQEVLIPAFIAAYTGKSAKNIGLTPFPKIPMPNWRITYNGLSKIEFLKRYLKTVTLSHGYRSNYSVGSYTTNVLFKDPNEDGFTAVKNAMNYDYYSQKEINQVSISEQFGPLINVDMTWNNSLLSKIQINKSRNLNMSFANNQLTEVASHELVIGAGYRFKDVIFYINSGGHKTQLKSDLNVKADISIRTNRNTIRKLVENINQVSQGSRVISINLSADYLINEKITVRVFFDKIINKPFVSSQFPNSNTNAGISVRFTLAQ